MIIGFEEIPDIQSPTAASIYSYAKIHPNKEAVPTKNIVPEVPVIVSCMIVFS